MIFVDIPTEQTTAATDMLLSLIAVIAMVCIRRGGVSGARLYCWVSIFSCLAVAAFLGALAHGLELSLDVKAVFWALIYLALALLVALFVLAVGLDVFGEARARQALWPLIMIALCFFVYTLVAPNSFLPFIVYEMTAMLMALFGYIWLLLKRRAKGAGWMLSGVALTLFAAAVQATKMFSFTLLWPFDHNGVYHLLQLVAVLLLVKGILTSSNKKITR